MVSRKMIFPTLFMMKRVYPFNYIIEAEPPSHTVVVSASRISCGVVFGRYVAPVRLTVWHRLEVFQSGAGS